jgi:hypothetical protein
MSIITTESDCHHETTGCFPEVNLSRASSRNGNRRRAPRWGSGGTAREYLRKRFETRSLLREEGPMVDRCGREVKQIAGPRPGFFPVPIA